MRRGFGPSLWDQIVEARSLLLVMLVAAGAYGFGRWGLTRLSPPLPPVRVVGHVERFVVSVGKRYTLRLVRVGIVDGTSQDVRATDADLAHCAIGDPAYLDRVGVIYQPAADPICEAPAGPPAGAFH